MTTTEKLLNELNALCGKKYPDKGYCMFQDVRGDGRNIRSVYVIINDGGGVAYSGLNDSSARKRCENIRNAISKQKQESKP